MTESLADVPSIAGPAGSSFVSSVTRTLALRSGDSVLFAAGVHPKIATAAPGHTSEAFTMSVYQHMLNGMGEQVAQVISVALPGLGTNWAHSERDEAMPDEPQSDETLAT